MKRRIQTILAVCLVMVCLCLPDRAEAAGSWKASGDQWYYRNEDGSYAAGWLEIDGAWYYFDEESGAMASGWKEIAGRWYYFGASGKMRTGWQEISGKWYYFGASGKMRTGWQEISGKWYYFGENGRMRTGWQEIGGKWYYLAESGRMMTGWQKISGKWYHLAAGGAMDTGWRKIGSDWYYLGRDGAMRTGWQEIAGKWYFLQGDGAMATGWLQQGDDWYYLLESGARGSGGMLEIAGKRYAFAEDGRWRGEQDDCFFAAADFLAEHEIVTDEMTKEEKLRACYDWLANKKNYSESNPWIPHYKGVDWPQRYAGYFFEHTTGNCFGVNAAFAYMAKAIGYDEVYCCNSGAHGWAEVDGLVYDPEWSRYHTGNFFGLRYEDSDSKQDYKSALRRDVDWRYVKI